MLRALRGAVERARDAGRRARDEVIAFDDEVDARYHRIEKVVEELLARQTPGRDRPAARARDPAHLDLHLERIGDHCVTIAKLTKLAAEPARRTATLVEGFREMGERGEEMIRDRARLASRSATSSAPASLVELDELIDRDEPPRRRHGARDRRAAGASRSGGCG